MSTITAQSRARLKVLADQAYPVGSTVSFYKDAKDGVVDYATALNAVAIAIWAVNGAGKIGYGRGRYGRGGYGHGEGGLGYGAGLYGAGGYGTGGDWVEAAGADGFLTAELDDGDWTFGAKVTDPAGNASSAKEAAATLAGTPDPPTALAADSYAGGRIALTFTVSDDDT